MVERTAAGAAIDDRPDRPVINSHFIDIDRGYEKYDADRRNYARIFGNLVNQDPGISGRVLDVGCGHGYNASYSYYGSRIGQLDGVDPFPMVEPAEHLANRWTCGVEDIPVGPNTYDLAYSFWVVEHIADIEPFLTKVVSLLKPGASYWALAPNAAHPFTMATKLAQFLKVKEFLRRNVDSGINDYPSYYRLCDPARVAKVIKDKKLPVSKVDFYFIPCVDWDHYVPKRLRFVARALDEHVLLRAPSRSFVLIFRIQRAPENADGAVG